MHLNQYCVLFLIILVTLVVQCRDTIRKKKYWGLFYRSQTGDLSLMFILRFKPAKWLTPQPAGLYLETCFKPVPCSLKNRLSKSCRSVQEENQFLFNSQQVKGVQRMSSLRYLKWFAALICQSNFTFMILETMIIPLVLAFKKSDQPFLCFKYYRRY